MADAASDQVPAWAVKPQHPMPMGVEAGWTHRRDHDAMRKKDNPWFVSYYRDHQKIVKDDAEWEELMAVMRTPLPSTLWINDTDPLAQSVSEHLASLGDLVKPIPWYPVPNMAWQIEIDKKRFRKDPELHHLRQYLIRQTAMGTTSRQEAVSMIPPFMLQIGPNDRCLDMCASPGSKTAQMLAIMGRQKIIHNEAIVREGAGPQFDYTTRGCVVANEKDEKRANMLVYQVKRLRQLFPFAMFVNHDARYLPDLLGKDGSVIKYDKILCDVVCTGDGTIRKAPGMIPKWKPFEATSLQRLQIQIALRGCHLLRVGGRLVYSTCSMNPIENEAVVTQLVKRTNWAMRLVDASSIIPGLKHEPGMSTWKVISAKGEVANQPGEHQMHEACFPPTAEEAAKMRLDLCLRLMPKHCDGGAFFVAVLEKVAEYEQPPTVLASTVITKKKSRSEAPPAAAAASEGEAVQAAEEAAVTRLPPPTYLPSYEDAKTYLTDYIGAQGFPTELLYSRTPNGTTELKMSLGSQCTLVSADVKDLISSDQKLIVVAAGLRTLAVETLTKSWRVAQEACTVMEPYINQSSRLLYGVPADVAQLCGPESDANGIAIDKVANPALQEAVRAMSIGCCILRVATALPAQSQISVSVMRARNRFQLLVDKDDLDDLKCRLDIGPPTAEQNANDE